VCSFNNKLYKFGGLENPDSINHYVEQYDIARNQWKVVNVEMNSHNVPILFSTSCCLQINNKEILIFGGYNHENEATNVSYILDTESFKIKKDEIL